MLFTGFFLKFRIPMFNVSWLYTHSRWSVSRHPTHDGCLICWSSFTGAVILMLHGQCVTQVARGDIVIIIYWCLCDFLVLKHIDEVYALHLHLSLTDDDIFLCCKCSRISILFLTLYWCWLFFMCKSSHHFWLMFMWFSCIETYWWNVCTSSSFVIYWCWHIFLSKMFQNFNIVFDYLLILIIFHVQNVLIIFNWCLCDFLVLKHIHEV